MESEKAQEMQTILGTGERTVKSMTRKQENYIPEAQGSEYSS